MYFPIKTSKLEKALKGLYGHLVEGDNITITEIDTIATKELVNNINKFYRDNQIDYQMIMDLGTKIEELPYNQQIDLTLIKGSRLKPYTMRKGRITSVDYMLPYGKYNSRYSKLGVLDKDVTLPMITDDKGLGWMVPVYFEETTMRPAVNQAKGRGYYFT